jgi:hypothetical protein
LRFPRTTFRTLSVTIDATSAGIRKTYNGESAVGFADVKIPGVPASTETLRLPTDMLSAAGAASASHQLDIILNRARAQVTPPRSDPELTLDRQFTLPTTRRFSIGGLARISTLAPDPVINAIIGRTAATSAPRSPGEARIDVANSSGRLPGDLNADAAAAVDGNPATSWMPGLGPQDGGWVEYALSKSITFDHLDLVVVADGRHSIPTSITVKTASGSRHVTLPHVSPGQGRAQGSVTSVPVQFSPLSGSDVRITIDATDPVHFLDYVSDRQNTEPVGLAEVGIPGVAVQTTPRTIPPTCHPNLLQIDGKPIDVEISGSTKTALGNGALSITGCGNSASGVTLSAGTHIVTTSPYTVAGLNLDTLTLDSAAGGAALRLSSSGQITPSAVPVRTSAKVTVLSQNRTGMKVAVHGDGTPLWLVLGESQNRGWVATTQSGLSLGSSTLIDGYSNGWYIPARAADGTTVVNIEWQPQRVVAAAILTSAAALAVSAALVLVPPGLVGRRLTRRRKKTAPRHRHRHVPVAMAVPGASALASAPPSARTATSEVGVELHPVFALPLRSGGSRPTWYAALGIAVVGGLLAAAIVAPLAGIAVALLLVLGLLVDRSRLVLVLGSVGLVALTGVVMSRGQFIHRFVPDIMWPTHFPLANGLTWMSVCLLGADAVVVAVRHRLPRDPRRRRHRGRPDGPDGPDGPGGP